MILAIETSGSRCGVALWQDGLVGGAESEGGLKHNEILFGQIKSLMDQHKIKLDDLSVVAISSGPGSFTGLRVGMAAAKGLCWSLKLPLIAIPTLEGLGYSVPVMAGQILPVMPARGQEIYWSLFEYDRGGLKQLKDDALNDISDLGDICEGNVFLCGEGYAKHKIELDRVFSGRRIRISGKPRVDPLVVSVARLAAERFRNQEFDDLMKTEPRYCYPFPRRHGSVQPQRRV